MKGFSKYWIMAFSVLKNLYSFGRYLSFCAMQISKLVMSSVVSTRRCITKIENISENATAILFKLGVWRNDGNIFGLMKYLNFLSNQARQTVLLKHTRIEEGGHVAVGLLINTLSVNDVWLRKKRGKHQFRTNLTWKQNCCHGNCTKNLPVKLPAFYEECFKSFAKCPSTIFTKSWRCGLSFANCSLEYKLNLCWRNIRSF